MRSSRARVRPIVGAVVLSVGLLAPAGVTYAAAPNGLDSPSVAPRRGDTATVFTFGVHYAGRYPARRVSVSVGPTTIELRLVDGTATDGRYQGSTRLPPGTFVVTFSAVAQKANSPSLSDGSVRVSGPSPTPKPSLAATAAPSLTRTSAPSSPATPAGGNTTSTASPTNPAGAIASGTAAPSGDDGHLVAGGAHASGETGPATADASEPVAPMPWPVPFAGLSLVALVVGYYLFATRRDRGRQEGTVDPVVAAAPWTPIADAAPAPARTPAVWELDARLEDAPIGTVDYLPLENGAAIGSLPEELGNTPDRRRSRLDRINDARRGTIGDDRRSLLSRSRLND